MRSMFLSLFFAMAVSALAQQPSASEQLKEKFIAILKQQLSEMAAPAAAENPQMSAEEIAKRVDAFTAKAATVYGSLITLPEAEANQLLTNGPDDKANMVAMQRDIGLWKTVELPMPGLLKTMQGKVAAGEIKGGLELELIRRISDFHLRQLGKLSP